ncbi:XLF-domain-containing protein [Trichocladium antarcticum]|uniref:Non-homologous end-joining factor 1 n=1 Tax=Trichocladium antarcticum TaxID=1450529 RepID=A0AAN6UQ88_9PEZI|nr:XLF-domain-containing protein [Trichocladium antarcticum]
MSGHPSWRQLPAVAPGIPALLVSTAFTADSYSVNLSDLANVWVERMDRKPLIMRGMVEDTSIDLSDGPDQIRKLLELVRAAFDVNDPAHPNTSLTLAGGDDGNSLVVHITCLLPEPLKPLRWPMYLRKCPQSAIAPELVLPLIQAHDARTQEMDQLFSALREKDGVITRLVDKLEATGSGLEYVFNSLSGKRKVTRAAAEGKVKGLAPFSETEFRSRIVELPPVAQSADVSALLGSVFGATGLQHKSDLDLQASTALDDWWTKLVKGKGVMLSERLGKQDTETLAQPQLVETKRDDDNGDFQVQATPPPRSRSTAQVKAVDSDETSDGDDTAEPLASSPHPPKAASTPRTSGFKLGAIGNRQISSTPPPPARVSKRTAVIKNTAADSHSETASEGEEDEPTQPAPASPLKEPPRRSGLGRIGGKPKQQTPTTRYTRSPSPAALADEPNPLPRRNKLGVIGKKAPGPSRETASASVSDDGRGRSKTPASVPKKEQHRETSRERADRKRVELQKDLGKRAAAGPAKKKRKF